MAASFVAVAARSNHRASTATSPEWPARGPTPRHAGAAAPFPFGMGDVRPLVNAVTVEDADPTTAADAISRAISAGLKATNEHCKKAAAAAKLGAVPQAAVAWIARAAAAVEAVPANAAAATALTALGGATPFTQANCEAAGTEPAGNRDAKDRMQEAARCGAEAAIVAVAGCPVDPRTLTNAIAAAVAADRRAQRAAALPRSARVVYPYGVDPAGTHGYKIHPVPQAIQKYRARGWTERRNTSLRADVGAGIGDDATTMVDPASPMGHAALGWVANPNPALETPLAGGPQAHTCTICGKAYTYNY